MGKPTDFQNEKHETSDLPKREDLHLEYQKRPTWRNATLKGQGTRCQIPCVYLNLELCPYGLTTTFFNTHPFFYMSDFPIRGRIWWGIELVRRPVGFRIWRMFIQVLCNLTWYVWRWSRRRCTKSFVSLRAFIILCEYTYCDQKALCVCNGENGTLPYSILR